VKDKCEIRGNYLNKTKIHELTSGQNYSFSIRKKNKNKNRWSWV